MKPTSTSRIPRRHWTRYANYFEVGHSAYEFFVDFGQYRPNTENVQIQLRVVTGPVLRNCFHPCCQRPWRNSNKSMGPSKHWKKNSIP